MSDQPDVPDAPNSLGDDETLFRRAAGGRLSDLVDSDSRYEIVRRVGGGGMGEVFKAIDRRLNRPVALKRMLGELVHDPQAASRFLTEAQAVAALNHVNIVHVYDYGCPPSGPFLVMEYVEGQSLAQRLEQGPLSVEEALDLVGQICDGLSLAHGKGIIHRDIKPANILLTSNGLPKLADFGLARQQGVDRGRTQTGAVLGTLDFMSPEQRLDASRVDARSDLWSLAATLYQALTGKPPLMMKLSLLPVELRPVLEKALEHDPPDRFQTAADLRQALGDVAARLRNPGSSAAVKIGRCPKCAAVNDPARKFCLHCGTALRNACPACGVTAGAWEPFCGECGADILPKTDDASVDLQGFEKGSTVVEIQDLQVTAERRSFDGKSGQTRDDNKLKLKLVWCPPGKFIMGDSQRGLSLFLARLLGRISAEVTLTRGFWLGETVVTQGQWQKVMGTTPWKGRKYVKEGPDYPATFVSHGDAGDEKLEADSAALFCQKLTDQERLAGRLPAGWKYTLPTEAQWEYACRAGTTTKYSFGDDESLLREHAWFENNAEKVGERYAHQVGLKKPNRWGLRDMHGNVWEWCADWYESSLPGGTDPAVHSRGSDRVDRGGSWHSPASDCRSARRDWGSPGLRCSDLGFRVAGVPSSE